MRDRGDRRGGELAIIAFGGGGVRPLNIGGAPSDDRASIFVPVGEVSIPSLTAAGHTPLEHALNLAMDIVERRLDHFRDRERMRPNMIVLTDGAPTDEHLGMPVDIDRATIARLRRMELTRRG